MEPVNCGQEQEQKQVRQDLVNLLLINTPHHRYICVVLLIFAQQEMEKDTGGQHWY